MLQHAGFVMSRIPRLHKRNNTYYIRVAVPRKLVDNIGKNEIIYSLKTNNYYDALLKLRWESAKIDNILFNCGKKMYIENNGKISLSNEEINRILLDRWKKVKKFFDTYETIESIKSGEKVLHLISENGNGEEYIKNYLFATQHNYHPHSIEYDLINNICSGKVALGSCITNQTNEDFSDWYIDFEYFMHNIEEEIKDIHNSIKNNTKYNITTRKVKELEELHLAEQRVLYEEQIKNTSTTMKLTNKHKWQDVMTDWFNSHYKQGNRESSYNQNKRHLEIIFGWLGKEYLEDITERDAFWVQDNLPKLPHAIKQKYPNLSIKDAIKQAHQDGIETLSLKTAGNYLSCVKSLYTFAYERNYITFNPFTKVKGKYKNTEDESFTYAPFTINELNAIFNPNSYPCRNYYKDAHNFWIPIIALYSGMRINEICQIHTEDVKRHGSIYYFDINETGNKHLKTKQSNRFVPIHPILKELGFIDYVKENKNNERLFPLLNKSVHNDTYARRIGDWFRRHLKKSGVKTDRTKTFHSFRHTTRIGASNNKISEDVINSVCGWAGQGVGQQVYGKGFEIKDLHNAWCKLNYKGFKINLLIEKYQEVKK